MSEVRVVVASACRTPLGSFNGSLASLSAPELGSVAIREVLDRAGLTGAEVDEVFMGEVLTAGVGQAPARQASLGAGIPVSVPCTTINKVCGSGMKSVMLAAQAIRVGDADIVVAGGMESMSRAPYLLDRARTGYRLGHGELTDSLLRDGLWDVYNDFHMGEAAELCAAERGISRQAQDEFAVASYRKAQEAQDKGYFDDEVVPVTVAGRKKGTETVSQDEEPQRADFDRLPALEPVFKKDGTVTVANASSLSDGAAACVVMSQERAGELGIEPLAAITAYGSVAREPEWFTLAPAEAIPRVLRKASLDLADIDLFEINEAFAVVGLAVVEELGLDMSRVNVHGGAVALGHPLGASGARILVTLLYAMRRYDRKRGLATVCIGGGEATSLIAER